MYNEIKRELYATDRECEICSNQILHVDRIGCRVLALKCSKNYH